MRAACYFLFVSWFFESLFQAPRVRRVIAVHPAHGRVLSQALHAAGRLVVQRGDPVFPGVRLINHHIVGGVIAGDQQKRRQEDPLRPLLSHMLPDGVDGSTPGLPLGYAKTDNY